MPFVFFCYGSPNKFAQTKRLQQQSLVAGKLLLQQVGVRQAPLLHSGLKRLKSRCQLGRAALRPRGSGEASASSPSGCGPDSASGGRQAEVPVPSWLTVGGRCLLLEAAHVPSLAFPVAPPATVGQVPLLLQISVFPPATPLTPARESFLLLRAHGIRVSLPEKPG